MAEPKTRPTKASVPAFLKKSASGPLLDDCKTVVEIMEAATGAPAVMWGTAIVGFGSYEQVYANGKTLDWMLVGMAPRKGHLTLYGLGGFPEFEALLPKLGPLKQSGSCLHLKGLEQVHLPTLKKIVKQSVQARKKKHAAA